MARATLSWALLIVQLVVAAADDGWTRLGRVATYRTEVNPLPDTGDLYYHQQLANSPLDGAPTVWKQTFDGENHLFAVDAQYFTNNFRKQHDSKMAQDTANKYSSSERIDHGGEQTSLADNTRRTAKTPVLRGGWTSIRDTNFGGTGVRGSSSSGVVASQSPRSGIIAIKNLRSAASRNALPQPAFSGVQHSAKYGGDDANVPRHRAVVKSDRHLPDTAVLQTQTGPLGSTNNRFTVQIQRPIQVVAQPVHNPIRSSGLSEPEQKESLPSDIQLASRPILVTWT